MSDKKPKKKESIASLKRKIKILEKEGDTAFTRFQSERYLRLCIEKRCLLKMYEIHFSGEYSHWVYDFEMKESPCVIHAMSPEHAIEIIKHNICDFKLISIKTIAV